MRRMSAAGDSQEVSNWNLHEPKRTQREESFRNFTFVSAKATLYAVMQFVFI